MCAHCVEELIGIHVYVQLQVSMIYVRRMTYVVHVYKHTHKSNSGEVVKEKIIQ